jgi:RIO kinase 2
MASVAKLYEYVSAEIIRARTGIPDSRLFRSLRNLVDNKLITPHKRYQSIYRLTLTGINVASLHGLLRRGLISGLRERIGLGKESLVYLATKGEELLVVKFHRIGITSFRHIVRVRNYGPGFDRLWWGARSIVSAEREYRALEIMWKLRARVPRPVGREYNAVVTSYIDGADLYRARDLRDPQKVLDGIIEIARKAYHGAGIVHGDLSPYNVLVSSDDEEPYVIDWPQWVRSNEENAMEILEKDLSHIADFFRKRFGLEVGARDLVEIVVGSGDV